MTYDLLRPVERLVRALARAVGIRVVDHARLKDRPDHAHQGVVHHPVAVGRGADLALLALDDDEILISLTGYLRGTTG